MIFIDDTKRNIIIAKKEHYAIVYNYLESRHFNNNSFINKFIKRNISDLISGHPDVLFKINKNFYNNISRHYNYNEYLTYLNLPLKNRTTNQNKLKRKYENLHVKIEKIINYSNWFIKSKKHYDYKLAYGLEINSCTYCNRIYTNTMKTDKNQKVMRPQFDHWFPKSKFPLLGLSFYNLIPSCSVCNSTAKSDSVFNLNTHLHPYVDSDYLNRFSFSYNYFRTLNELKIKINNSYSDIKAFKTIKDLNLLSMYNAHTYELKDLIKIKLAYSHNYLNDMIKAYPGANLSFSEVYRLAFGVEYLEENFHKRPFSKFKKDILTELKIIK